MHKIIQSLSLSEQGKILADYLPSGKFWDKKNIYDSNLRKLLNGLFSENYRLENILNLFVQEMDISQTNILIDRWEKVFGIPDDCFSNTNLTLSERINQILIKIKMNGAQTKQDFIYIASLLGLNIEITEGGSEYFDNYTLPFVVFNTDIQANTSFVVKFLDIIENNFPYEFDFTFTTDSSEKLKCIFKKIKPVHTQIYYIYQE